MDGTWGFVGVDELRSVAGDLNLGTGHLFLGSVYRNLETFNVGIKEGVEVSWYGSIDDLVLFRSILRFLPVYMYERAAFREELVHERLPVFNLVQAASALVIVSHKKHGNLGL